MKKKARMKKVRAAEKWIPVFGKKGTHEKKCVPLLQQQSGGRPCRRPFLPERIAIAHVA